MLPLLASLLVAPAFAADAPGVPSAPLPPAAKVGQPAPDFALKDLNGKEVKLSSFAGKTVVIEWFNPGCPFVVYAHGEGPLKDMAKNTTGSGNVVWFAINSSAPGKQGHGVELNQQATASWGMTHQVLLDESGTVGKRYGATTTPNMFVVDGKGTLVYAGALDNAPLGKAEGPPVNYVRAAIEDVGAGRPVKTPTTKPYGCGVKYGS
jgi:glutathione peroxidase-family protein